jgi:adenylate cyclase
VSDNRLRVNIRTVSILEVTAGAQMASPISNHRVQRRLCAILAGDLAGYARLMEADEERTHLRLQRLRHDLLEPGIARWSGRIVKHTGDGFLALFDNLQSAIGCAIELQRELGEAGTEEAPDRRFAFRMGLNLSDTIIEADDIFGEGVNIAARLQAYAEPGGLVVPAAVAEQIEARPGLRRVDLGDLPLKNISKPVRAISLHFDSKPQIPRAFAAASRTKMDNRPSIAVLPFRQQLEVAGADYFSDGIVDDIIRSLSGIKDLVVIARGSTLEIGAARADTRAIGRELGARYVLNGGVVRAAGRIRINTELTDAESGVILWAERHDGVGSDLFALQDRISLQVVSTLAPQIREQELKRALRKHPDSMDAYDLVLQAINLLYRMEYEPFSGARSLLQQARILDDDYAPAWTYAAQWHTFRIGQGWSSDQQADALEAERLALAAIERDRNDAAALAVGGHASSFLRHDYEVGRELVDRALEVGPSCALAWTLGSCTCSYMGEGPEAVSRAEHSLRLSPRDPLAFFYLCNMGIAHYANGDYEETVRFARRAAAHKKTFRANLRMLAAGLVALGRLDEARAVGLTLSDVDPGFRLSRYRNLCPWQHPDTLEKFLERLHQAGLPS